MKSIFGLILVVALMTSCVATKEQRPFDPRLAASETGVDVTALPDLGSPAEATDSLITYDTSAAEGSRITERKFSGNALHLLDGDAVFRVLGDADIPDDITISAMSDFTGFFNGTFKETFNALVTESTGLIVMSLQSTTAGDLTMRFSDGRTTLDCTPAKTINLTAGLDDDPQGNYIYILQSDKILTKSTTQWPTAEHIKVGYFAVQTSTFVADYGAVINQNWNDGANDDANQGHLTHMTQWTRSVGAKYFSGIDGAGVDAYITTYAGGGYFKVNAGVVTQMHRHTVPAVDTETGGVALCANYPSDGFKVITDLNDILVDSAGASLTNKYFNIIIGGVANKSGEFAPLMVKLPSGSYTSSSAAVNDVDHYTDYAMPRMFNKESSTGFLIARVTIRNQSDTTFTIVQTQDLRGQDGALAAGSTGGNGVTNFADSDFSIYDNLDPTRIISVDAGGITTGNNRVISMPDTNVNLGDIATNSAKVTNATHTGDVTGSGELTIGTGVVEVGMVEADLKTHTLQFVATDPTDATYVSGYVETPTGATWESASVTCFDSAGVASTETAFDVDVYIIASIATSVTPVKLNTTGQINITTGAYIRNVDITAWATDPSAGSLIRFDIGVAGTVDNCNATLYLQGN